MPTAGVEPAASGFVNRRSFLLSYMGMAPLAGLEPAASGSGNRCAIRCATRALNAGLTDGRALTPDGGHGICGYAASGSVAGVRVLS